MSCRHNASWLRQDMCKTLQKIVRTIVQFNHLNLTRVVHCALHKFFFKLKTKTTHFVRRDKMITKSGQWPSN